MLPAIGGKFINVGKRSPIKTLILFLLSAGYIGSLLFGPKLFVNGLNDIADDDKKKAYGHFAGADGLFFAFLLIPLIQELILSSMGTKLSQEILDETLRAFFNSPLDTERNPTQGENYTVVDRFGGAAQPGGISMDLLQRTLRFITDLFAMIAIVAFMWHEIGSSAWPNLVQVVLFLLIASGMSKIIGETFEAYIKNLYAGFARTIVFANYYITNLILGQQSQARKAYMDFIKDILNPSTRKTLRTNLIALMITATLGVLATFAGLAWGVKSGISADKFILQTFYSIALTALSMGMMFQLIAGMTAWALLIFAVKYILKGAEQNLPAFSLNPPANVQADPVSTQMENISVQPASIQMTNVSCIYPGKKTPVSHPISVTINQGDVVVISGKNGAGKSTIVQMFCGFVKPSEGEIKFLGQDITKINLDSFRKHCAFVLQDLKVREGTYRSNICSRYPNASDELVRKCMKDVALGIVKRDKEYDEYVVEPYDPNTKIGFGHNGPTISGGEQQKTILARVFLDIIMGAQEPSQQAILEPIEEEQDNRPHPIKYLFLDEFLKGIDQQSQHIILQSLARIVKEYNVTTIIVSHNVEQLLQYFHTIEQVVVTRVEHPAQAAASGNSNSFYAPVSPAKLDKTALDIHDDSDEAVKAKKRIGGTEKIERASSPSLNNV